MTKSYFSKDEQMELLIRQEWSAAIMKLHPEIKHRELTFKYLSVTPEDVLSYFKKNPAMARAHLEKWEALRPTHDVAVVWHDNGIYKVAMMDHGEPCDITEHKTMAEAVAEHFCLVCLIPRSQK